MIQVGEIVVDADFVQSFTVKRSSGQFGSGGWIEGTPALITMTGTVTVASEKDIQQIPEADRIEGAMMFYTTQPLFVTHDHTGGGTSDQLQWRDEWYRIQRIWPWGDYGYYKAYCYRMLGT